MPSRHAVATVMLPLSRYRNPYPHNVRETSLRALFTRVQHSHKHNSSSNGSSSNSSSCSSSSTVPVPVPVGVGVGVGEGVTGGVAVGVAVAIRVDRVAGPSPSEGCFLMAGGFVSGWVILRKSHTARKDDVPSGHLHRT